MSNTGNPTVKLPGGRGGYGPTDAQIQSSRLQNAAANGTVTNVGPAAPRGFNDFTRQAPKSSSITQNKPTKSDVKLVPNTRPDRIKFNLPPHKWSLPLDQEKLNINNTKGVPKLYSHATRRAMMWCYGYTSIDATDGYTFTESSSFQPARDSQETAGRIAESVTKPTSVSTEDNTAMYKPLDTNWGFQFLWNPEKIGNALSRNANFTPTAADKTAQFFGLFTAMEGVSFNIVIDRVNDFAHIRSLPGDKSSYARTYDDIIATDTALAEIATYYAGNGYPSRPDNPEDIIQQIKDLRNLGTMADIEYIFRMINGQGTDGRVFKNALERKTSDLGFLAPTVIAVQFGPSSAHNLSYVGYVDGISITHNLFTEDMIPIHSEVSVNYVAFARTQLASK